MGCFLERARSGTGVSRFCCTGDGCRMQGDSSVSFHAVGRWVAYLGVDMGSFKLLLVSAHLPRSEGSDDESDEAVMILGDIVEKIRRAGCTNVVGLDANA
eukprot:3354689-Pyramimonas_sp.AAC.1